jgi:hypothetical protein
MTRTFRWLMLGLTVGVAFPVTLDGVRQDVERRLERTFTVQPDSLVVVRITGGPITVSTGSGRSMSLTLDQRISNTSSEARADEALQDYEISAVQQGGTVTLTARRHPDRERRWRRGDVHVSFQATLTVPADVRLQLDTSGGPIMVRGERLAHVDADTSGGPITVDGGRANFILDTSGGAIRVGRVLGNVRANTSGGGITVDYVGPTATEVLLDTSGGSIRVGVDRAARLDITAATSGGSVDINDLPFETRSLRRSRASGTINGGGGRLTADTSGGSIEIRGMER